MKIFPKHIILLICGVLTFGINAQNDTFKGYKIEGDTVVFSFDKRDYKTISHDYYGLKRDFKDLNIENVVVSGEFNDWSKDHWRMTKIDENRYQLKKSISDFNDAFSWEFKFVINNAFWAEPDHKVSNRAPSEKNGLSLYDTYNLKMFTAYPSHDGNATFTLKGYKNAKNVVVSGSFNKWDEHMFKMKRVGDAWKLTLKIKPGVYQYRFIVDGHWMEDPNNTNKARNEFNAFNSVLDIKAYTAFKLRGYNDAKKVILAGSFNNWNEHQLEMEKTNYGWKYVIPLTGGKYHYKFIVDGQWITDPNNSIKEYDNSGNINSVFMVK